METHYRPGLHLLATLKLPATQKILHQNPFRQLIDDLIVRYDLQALGAVYHDFPAGGFTGVVCLSESHLSIHTWPEHLLANVDVYLSNHERRNEGTVREIFAEMVALLDAEVTHQTEIVR